MIVHSPEVPYWDLIPDAGQVGTVITVEGQAPRSAYRFAIDLMIGESFDGGHESKDIALHLNPRINENRVVCNSRSRGKWGSEEYSRLPLTRETPFKITIHVLSMRFKVTVDDEPCCCFTHRLAKEEVGMIRITGDVAIERLSCQSLMPKAPPPPPPKPIRCDIFRPGFHAIAHTVTPDLVDGSEQEEGRVLIRSPRMPLQQQIGGLAPGDVIRLRGRPLASFARFALDLGQAGSSVVALHVNPRRAEQTVVRNSRSRDGRWQAEERTTPFFPFAAGRDFVLQVRVMHDRFVILINERNFADFEFRILPLEPIDLLTLTGDVDIESVQVTKG